MVAFTDCYCVVVECGTVSMFVKEMDSRFMGILFVMIVLPGMVLILPISFDCIGVDVVLMVLVCFSI